MNGARAQRFPASTRAKTLEWDTFADRGGNIHVIVQMPGLPEVHVTMSADDFYELTEDIRNRYDEVCGI